MNRRQVLVVHAGVRMRHAIQHAVSLNLRARHLDRILTIGKKLNRYTKESELSDLLDLLQVKKPGPKSEIFQRISFLIEFSRIHREFQAKQKNWDLVKS